MGAFFFCHMMSDEVPDFLQGDLLGLENSSKQHEEGNSGLHSNAPGADRIFGGFQSKNLSIFSSPFYSSNSPDNNNPNIHTPIDTTQGEFTNFTNNLPPNAHIYDQSPHESSGISIWSDINSGFSNMNLGPNRESNEQEQSDNHKQSDFFNRPAQPTGRFPVSTQRTEIPYNPMVWNGDIYSSGSPLFSDAAPQFSNIYAPHHDQIGSMGHGLESPIRSGQREGSSQRDDFRGIGSGVRSQMTGMRAPIQNGSMFPMYQSHGVMMQPQPIPGQQRVMIPDFTGPTAGRGPIHPPGSPGHQRSASVDTYTESELFGGNMGAEVPTSGGFRHKRNPSATSADIIRDQTTKQISGCRYYANGYCSRGDRCNYDHILPTPNDDKNVARGALPQGRGRRPRGAAPVINDEKTMESRYQSLDQVVGQVYSMCKDQHGCRFLQKKLEEKDNNFEAVNLIFDEVYDHMVELMTDPFGNYLCQKLIEHCDEHQQLIIVQKVAPKLVEISKNMHGTRAVQKMIECLRTPAQIQLVVNALSSSVVELIQDLNGNHVIQRCLHRLSCHDKQFIYDAVAEHAIEVSTHRHGCCVMQRCIDSASNEQKLQLVGQISKNALSLVKDQFGNYVVQYVLELDFSIVRVDLIREFCGHIASLSTQKFSSNVIEKCLNVAVPAVQAELIQEIMQPTTLSLLLQDPFGNYVIQTALSIARPEQYRELVNEIKPLLPALRNTPYGKRIQNKIAKDGLLS